VTIVVALLVIVGGLLEIKDFFWYGKGESLMIPEEYAEKIADKMDNLSTPMAIVLGIFVAAVELPCTGGPYLAILTIISQQGVNLTAYGMMAIYNLIFVMPLIIIVALSYLGSYKVSEMKEWKHMNKARMRMAAGLLMVFLGWILLILATGIVRFG
jgi:cytochrome c biogenesis protein CcdA